MRAFTMAWSVSVVSVLSKPTLSVPIRWLQTADTSVTNNTNGGSLPTNSATTQSKVLQFGSVGCSTTKNDCGELNGYPLKCENLGEQDGEEKNQCVCEAAAPCQNTSAIPGFVPQYGNCEDQKCVDSYGFVSVGGDEKTYAEKLHCVVEANTTATLPAKICHTCQSCLMQNDGKQAHYTGNKRFTCTQICPPSTLKSLKVDEKEDNKSDDTATSDSGDISDDKMAKDKSSAASISSKTTTLIVAVAASIFCV